MSNARFQLPITTSIVTITPAIAEEWLALSGPNRELDWGTVARYARLMAAGMWALDGMTIKFDWDGRLIDGQHRLRAVIRSGVHIQAVVVRGLDPVTFETMDRGRMRSVGQTLHLRGMKNATALAAAALVMHHDEQNAMDRSWNLRLEPRELAIIIARHPKLHEAVTAVRSGCMKLRCNVGALAWCYYKFCEVDVLLAQSFFEAVFTGESLERGDPAFLLRARLIENAGSRARLTQKDICALVIKAWNAVVEGREMRQLKAPRRLQRRGDESGASGDGIESFPKISRGVPA